MTVLAKLVPELIAIIASYGSFAVPNDLPAVTFVPQGAIAQELCGRPCPAFAMFNPERGILLDERLDPLNDLNARSILLHELVHFTQWKLSGRLPGGCTEWLKREKRAYDIQFAWLARQGKGKRHFPVRRPVLAPVICGDRPYPLTR